MQNVAHYYLICSYHHCEDQCRDRVGKRMHITHVKGVLKQEKIHDVQQVANDIHPAHEQVRLENCVPRHQSYPAYRDDQHAQDNKISASIQGLGNNHQVVNQLTIKWCEVEDEDYRRGNREKHKAYRGDSDEPFVPIWTVAVIERLQQFLKLVTEVPIFVRKQPVRNHI